MSKTLITTNQIQVSTFINKYVPRESILDFIDEFLRYSQEPSWNHCKDSFYNINALFSCLD